MRVKIWVIKNKRVNLYELFINMKKSKKKRNNSQSCMLIYHSHKIIKINLIVN